MATIPLTITGATAPYNISVKKQGDNTERFISYNGTILTFNGSTENALVTYTIYLTDANQCPGQKIFTLNCGPKNCNNNPFDITFVVDESGSIRDTDENPDFRTMKNGIKLIIDSLSTAMNANLLRVGVAAFGYPKSQGFCARPIAYLGDRPDDVKALVDSFIQGKSETPMAAGLTLGNEINNGLGSRNVGKKLILITDGYPNQNVSCGNFPPGTGGTSDFNEPYFQEVQTIANNYKASGIEIITVGIALNTQGREFLQNRVASPNSFFAVNTFQEFEAIAQSIAQKICG